PEEPQEQQDLKAPTVGRSSGPAPDDQSPSLRPQEPLQPETPPDVAAGSPGRAGARTASTPPAVQPAPGPKHGPAVKTPVKVGGAAVERPGERPKRSLMPKAPEAAADDSARKSSWLTRLKSGLSRTGQSFTGLFSGVKVDEDLFEELETALIMSDAGMEATSSLLTDLRARVRKERIDDGKRVKEVLQELLTEHLKPLQRDFDLDRATPLVVMIAGV